MVSANLSAVCVQAFRLMCLEDMKDEADILAAEANFGPHSVLQHAALKAMWFKAGFQDEVLLETFWLAFSKVIDRYLNPSILAY